ncbi:UDP-N-acetylmuramate dehydrogenase [bacterium]|nr:UDP-N-acetylmuramate dehydrogenase [bacterium]
MIQPQKNVPVAQYTNYKIGGVAREMYFPTDTDEFIGILKHLMENAVPYYILGGGTNVLVGDRYWDGAVIITIGMNRYETFDDCIVCGAGLKSSLVSEIALDRGKTGLEFMYLLPGTIGGALAMNARYDMKSISDVFLELVAVHPDRGKKTFRKEDIDFAYKKTGIIREGWLIAELTLLWEDGDSDDIRKHMADIESRRTGDHHFDYPSCGCVFKNVHRDNMQAGRLLDELGLKGFSVGDAQVSLYHANFVVNTGKATARDVLAVIEHIERVVKEKRGIELEREVQLVGAF